MLGRYEHMSGHVLTYVRIDVAELRGQIWPHLGIFVRHSAKYGDMSGKDVGDLCGRKWPDVGTYQVWTNVATLCVGKC